MSFVLSWSGYFSRKGWDPVLWAEAHEIGSYEQCAKRISKMCVQPPTREEYLTRFVRVQLVEEPANLDTPINIIPKLPPEVFVKQPRPEHKPVSKEKPKRVPRKRAPKKIQKVLEPELNSGTASIIDSTKKKTSTRSTRSRKNVKSS